MRRKIRAREQAMPIPAFAPGERDELLVDMGDEVPF